MDCSSEGGDASAEVACSKFACCDSEAVTVSVEVLGEIPFAAVASLAASLEVLCAIPLAKGSVGASVEVLGVFAVAASVEVLGVWFVMPFAPVATVGASLGVLGVMPFAVGASLEEFGVVVVVVLWSAVTAAAFSLEVLGVIILCSVGLDSVCLGTL